MRKLLYVQSNKDIFQLSSFATSLRMSKQEIEEGVALYNDDLISDQLNLVLMDEGKICGLCVSKVVEINRKFKDEQVLQHNLTKEIDNNNSLHHNWRVMNAIWDYIALYFDLNMPSDCKQCFVIKLFSVHPNYWNEESTNKLFTEILKLAKTRGYHVVQIICSTQSLNKIAERNGMRKICSYNINNAYYNGKPIFTKGTFVHNGIEFGLWRIEL